MGEARIAFDMWRAQREGPAGLARRRNRRLTALVRHARTASPLYRHLYRDLPADADQLRDLPTVTKPQLMAEFDDWLTDPTVTRAGVEAFIADSSRIGTLLDGRHWVCHTSGTTGEPGIFVHDRRAIAVYRAMTTRIDLAWLHPRDLLPLLHRRLRWAAVVGTGSHFAAASWMELERRRGLWRTKGYRVISTQQPLAAIVAQLNAFDPAILSAYPSALGLLAEERAAGRLHVRPVILETGGESMLEGDRAMASEAFGVRTHDLYGASEFNPMAYDCDRGWLHVASDWVILEPIEEDGSPTPAGQPSHSVLLTNLANRVQPIVRYDLGDSVLARPDPCPCGNVLPAIRVEGRRDDVLRLETVDGGSVKVLPLAIGAVMEATPGIRRSQLVRSGPRSVRLRLELMPGADAEQAWESVLHGLQAVLADQGLGGVEVVRASEPPAMSARGGKYRQVINEPV